MHAVLKTGGKQYRVSAGSTIRVEKLAANVGDQITFGEVLMLGDGVETVVGSPIVPGASVVAKVIAQGRGEKVRIFKMRRRKHYQKRQGHRQSFTQVEITAINA
jgi:large subunit ribosomal protein L21